MMGFYHFQEKQRVESGRSNFSPFRLLLFELAEEMDTTDLKTTLFNLSAVIPRSEHDQIKSICGVFNQLQRSGDLYPANIEVLYKLLKMMDRRFIISKVRTYQGAQLKEGNTELENRPVEEGRVTIATKTTEPVYLGKGQIPPVNAVEQQRPAQTSERSVQFIGNRLPLHLGQFQTSTASANQSVFQGVIPSQQEPIDIQGQIPDQSRNKNSRTDHSMDDDMRKNNKMQDEKTDKDVTSHQENPVFFGSQQERQSPGTNQSERCVGNQKLTEPSNSHRTEIQSQITVNPLVPRNNIKGDQSFGDSGLTVGAVLLPDRSLKDKQLSITESKLVELSEVIARRDDCTLLASALMIDYGRISEIMLANPTNVLRVHGFLKHWFIEQKNRVGTSPSTDGLLKAFQLLGFTDAIEEYVRLSQEPESEFEQDIPLAITESKLVELSEVIARRDDCTLLASALKIDYGRISEIMLANPTNVLRVHGFLKHWFIDQKNRVGTSPSTDGLLKAFQLLGFTDAIEEYVRLSREPESEFEQGEDRVSQGNEYTYVRAATPPKQRLLSEAEVASSLNPLTYQNKGQIHLHYHYSEPFAVDDSAMPFYKMNARPRGIAIIINNQHFHKISNDQSSKEMPTRNGTEKDAEKLDYIWRKLDFEVHLLNDVDSTQMYQILIETAFLDHSKYDCIVVSILTHGVLGHVYGADGRMVRISQLTNFFSGRRCPSLAGKPKLFFIQACQGREKQEGCAVETDGKKDFMPIPASSEERQDLNVDRTKKLIPDEADFLLGYATSPGYVSYRSRSQGSWYIDKLSQNLDKYAYQHDLLSILIKVNEEVGKITANIDNGAYKQIPAPMFTLRKRIIFR